VSLDKNIAAVILAAGESSRFGKPKQFLAFRGKTLLGQIADAARDANCAPIIVVAGSEKDEVEHELIAANVTIVQNKHWTRGIGSSIRAGIRHLIDVDSNADAAVLLVCDQPFVNSAVIKRLSALHERTNKPIVASSYANTLGVPALFDRSCYQELLALDDAAGAKAIILSNRERVAEFPFPEGNLDIDTVGDWEKVKSSPGSF